MDGIFSLAHCELCPRRCGANRASGERGYCGAPAEPVAALASLHPWEEPCLAGDNGAGTVFFDYCPLGCVYCQNFEISDRRPTGAAVPLTAEKLAAIFLNQQESGAATLDLVTPTHFAPAVYEALTRAKKRGLNLPVVWNCGGYERTELVEALASMVDVWLPDMKYGDGATAARYSAAPDYPAVALAAIRRMVEIAGAPRFDGRGILRRGVMVRHLVLPGKRRESIAVVERLWREFGDRIILSLMSQYTPLGRAAEFPEINRRVTTFEYDSVVKAAWAAGFRRAYIQERRSAREEYVPLFDGRGLGGFPQVAD